MVMDNRLARDYLLARKGGSGQLQAKLRGLGQVVKIFCNITKSFQKTPLNPEVPDLFSCLSPTTCRASCGLGFKPSL